MQTIASSNASFGDQYTYMVLYICTYTHICGIYTYIHVNMFTHVYIYLQEQCNFCARDLHTTPAKYISMYVCIHMHMNVQYTYNICICIYIYIYVYISFLFDGRNSTSAQGTHVTRRPNVYLFMYVYMYTYMYNIRI